MTMPRPDAIIHFPDEGFKPGGDAAGLDSDLVWHCDDPHILDGCRINGDHRRFRRGSEPNIVANTARHVAKIMGGNLIQAPETVNDPGVVY